MTDKTIPVYWDAATESIKPVSATQENTLGDAGIRAIIRDYSDKDDRYFGSLVKSSTNADSVGTMSDTFFTVPIGTHPGTSLSQGSINYTLYQAQDSAPKPAPTDMVFVSADSDGNLWEMNDSEQVSLGARLNERLHSNELGGSFRMATSAPSSDWDLWESSVFEDTIVDQGTVAYNIYRKNDGGSYTPSTYNPLKIHATKDLKETASSEVEEFMKGVILAAAEETGVGDYQIRNSGEGAPTESGTWVSRGVAVDTRNVTQQLQYTSEFFVGPGFTRQYTNQYTGQYTNIRYADVSSQFAGEREKTFAGSRTYGGEYAGDRTYTGQYVGSRSFAGSRNYASETYVGNRQFAGERELFWLGTRQFSGSRNYTDTYFYTNQFVGTRAFSGSRQSSFAGTRPGFVPATFVGLRQSWGISYYPYSGFYGGSRPGVNPGGVNPDVTNPPVITPGVVNPPSVNPPTPGGVNPPGSNPGTWVLFTGGSGLPTGSIFIPGNPTPGNPFGPTPGNPYPGNSNPAVTNPGNPVPGNPFPGNPANFAGSYAGSRQVGFAGATLVNRSFTGNRTVAYARQFTGPRIFQFTGARQFGGARGFAGSRTYTAQYTSNPSPFLGNYLLQQQFAGAQENFSGSRNYGDQYIRQFASFSGERTYAGEYAGDRTYTGQYVGAYTNQYTGIRAETYTGQYTGQYSRQYTASYTSQYSQQYTGETLVSLQAEVETYTLYCRISES